MKSSPEGITIKEEGNSFKIIYKYNLTFRLISFTVIVMFFVFLLISFIDLMNHQSNPLVLFLTLCPVFCFSIFLTSITRMTIEINDSNIKVYYRPLPVLPLSRPVPLNDIYDVCCEATGIFRIYSLKIILKNGKKVTLVKDCLQEKELLNFIQSTIQKKLGLEGTERKNLEGI